MEEPTDNRRELTRPLAGWILANWPRLAAALVVAVVAVVTGIISYGHIAWLTGRLGGSLLVAHLMPFAVDGQIIVGSIVLLAARERTAWWGWLGIVPGLAESLFANYMAGAPHGTLAAVWYMVAAQSFAVASFLLERLLKSLAGQPRTGVRAVRDEHAGETETEPATSPEPVIEYVTVEVPVTCGHEHPATLDEAIVAAYLHARDCTGEELSIREVARRYGQGKTRVAELVAASARPEPETPGEEAGAVPDEDGADTSEPEAASA